MSNYLFHQDYFADLAAFDADTFVDPFDQMVDEYDDGSPEPGFEGMTFEAICRELAEEADHRAAWGMTG